MTKNTDKSKGLWSLNPAERAEERKAQLRKATQADIEKGATLSALLEKHHVYAQPMTRKRAKAQKVFIPDNEGGGTWEAWKDDRPKYKAHAEALAEALRAAQAWLIACSDKDYTYARQAIAIKASEALAAWEGAQS